jgi:ParB family chromosome partitioning protein
MTTQTIPLNKLIPSPANVRKTGAAEGIEELAASIASHGLLQNLTVRPATRGGKFEVIAGGRRLAALKLLAKDGMLSKDVPITCQMNEGADAGEISLAENVVRLAMHPADQFDAFKAMADAGKGPEEIAARFGCTAAVVRQRLKLATVSPRLMDTYREGEMNLDQLMAFTVSDDHAAQEAAWFDQNAHNPSGIRRILTATQIEADDALALFVGIDAYAAAGGPINRDLFQPEHEGYLTDSALLDRLAIAKLNAEADTIRTEGWAWVDVMRECDYATLRAYGRATPEQQPLSDEQAEELDRLSGAYDALIDEYGEDPEPEIITQLEDLSERIDALSSGNVVWTPEVRGRSGVIVRIGHDGTLDVTRGLIRPEDRTKAPISDEDRETKTPPATPSGLSDRLVEDLTAHRTAALRSMLADNPAIALVSVVHAMALPLFYDHGFGAGSSLDLRITSGDLASSADGIADSPAARRLDERHADWRNQMPEDADAFWGWLLSQPTDRLTDLLAVCAGMSVNAVRKTHDKADASRLVHADQLATALGLDMTEWWQPTAAGFFGRITKTRILETVAEGCSKGAADNLAKLKKDALAKRAEAKLAGTGWLPAVLRSPKSATFAVAEAA